MAFRYLSSPLPHAFAHRGGAEAAPENTIAAFEHARSLGFTYLETDVHRTSDGVLVAFHDKGLERVAGLDGAIADYQWEELRAVDLGDGHRIPTLDELLTRFPDANFNIDPKADDAVEPLIEALRKHQAIDRVCVGSFNDRRIRRVRQAIGPGLCTSPGPRGVALLLITALMPEFVRRRRRRHGYGCVQVPPKALGIRLSRRMVDGFHDLGLLVHVWTINDRATMAELLAMGVDGIMTDELSTLRSLLIEEGRWNPFE